SWFALSVRSMSRTRKFAFEKLALAHVRPHVSVGPPRTYDAEMVVNAADAWGVVQVVPPSQDSCAQICAFEPLLPFRATSCPSIPLTDVSVAGTPRPKSHQRWRSLPASVQLRELFVPVLVSVATAASVAQALAGVVS